MDTFAEFFISMRQTLNVDIDTYLGLILFRAKRYIWIVFILDDEGVCEYSFQYLDLVFLNGSCCRLLILNLF